MSSGSAACPPARLTRSPCPRNPRRCPRGPGPGSGTGAGRMGVLHVDGPLFPHSRGDRSRSPAHRRARHAGDARARRGAARAAGRAPGPGAHLPGAAGAHVRAASARVLHAGVQLRRDVPRHPGARPQRRRRALPGRHRPQAADRALRVRGHVHVLRDHRALVGAGGGHARGRTHRAAARDRSASPLRRACRVDRGDPLRGRDDLVRAAGRPGGELRGVHAAVDDGGDPVRTTRARVPGRRRDRGGDPGQADRRGDAAPRRLPDRGEPWEARRRRGLRRLHHPDRAGRAGDGPVAAPLLDGARQRLVRRHEDDVDGRAHDCSCS